MFYIDPGTGSMLFTVLIGVLGAGAYALRDSIVKAKFLLSGGRTVTMDDEVPDFVIFSDDKRYWNVFKPICDEFEKREVPITYMTASENDPALNEKYNFVSCEFIGEGNKAFVRLNNLKADILLSTTPSLDVFYWKRSKNVKWYVHIPHAISDITLYRVFGIDYYDAILTPGEYHEGQIRELENIRNLPKKEVVKVGMTYMDVLKKRLETVGPIHDDITTVLLAPSWGPSAILSKFGKDIIKTLLDTGYHIIVRPHPQSFTSEKDLIEGIMSAYPDSEQLEWNTDNDNFDVLNRADIMISDFSGVVFDYSLVFDKPIIYMETDFDKSIYDADWIDEELWTFRTLPKIGREINTESLPQLKEIIDDCLTNPKYQRARDEARAETWVFEGESAVRTVDYLLEKHKLLTEKNSLQES